MPRNILCMLHKLQFLRTIQPKEKNIQVAEYRNDKGFLHAKFRISKHALD